MAPDSPSGKPVIVELDEGGSSPAERGRGTGEAGGGGDAAIVDEDSAPAVVDEDGAAMSGDLPPRAVANADGSVTLPLRKPVELQIRSAARGTRTERFDSLTLHELNGADMKAVAAASEMQRGVAMLAQSARLRMPVMDALWDRMASADISDAVQVVQVFFGSGRTTGR